jgi:hypothetical protein
MKNFIAVLLLFLAVPSAHAEIKLNAPDDCVVGELVTLDASESTCEQLKWQVLLVHSSLDECMDFKSFGKVACFSSRIPSTWLILISGVAEDGSPEMITHRLVVEGGIENPAVANLESKIKTWSKLVKTDREAAIKLAQSFRAISNADIPAEKFLEATAKANKQALDDSLEAWMPFLDRLGTYLDEVQLSTTADYQRVWVEIADGIERAFQ